MLDALTESFCERCGTRYEFAAPTRLNPLRKTRGLISGLRNYIMSQDALGDAVGDAMRTEEEALAAAQLDAFHQSFNFCIQCRQYACTNCWNEPEGRCRTCVPIAGTDDLIERFEASFHAQHPAPEPELGSDDLNRRLGVDAWPTEDLGAAAATNGHAAVDWPSEALTGEPERVESQAEVEPDALVAPEPMVVPEPVVAPEPAAAASAADASAGLESIAEADLWGQAPAAADEVAPMLPALEGDTATRWEDDAAFSLEPEPIPEPVPEPVAEVVAEVAFEPEPEPVAEVAFEPEPEPIPEPVAEVPPEPPAIRPIAPISETFLRIPLAAPAPAEEQPQAAEADDPALAARRAQLDLLGLGDPGEGPVAGSRDNVLPYRSSGASVHPAEMAARADAAGGAAGAGTFWEASAREVAGVMTVVGVQSCGHCGLSLSASARFCRRCGTRQAKSA